MDLLGGKRDPRQQALSQVGEVPVGVFRGGHSFVHLHHMHLLPRNFFAGQGPQHDPGRLPAADGHDEPAAGNDGVPSRCGDNRGALAGDLIGIGKYFHLHGCVSKPDQPVTTGFCQPPAGTTF
jgi:hypothetical protein